MSTAAQVLAKFSADLKFSDIPEDVVQRAKDCIINTVGISTFGSQLPWSKMMRDYATRYGSGGSCTLFGLPSVRVHTPYAALANGLCAHSFELDSTLEPSMGAHPGAVIAPAVLAACEETGADGKTAITAFVAGVEVLGRIAGAAHHSKTRIESLGFHAPGITGPYAAATGVARVYGLSAEQATNAIGIAGSLSSGILAFSKSKQGGMTKRLHLGRASESGVLAARLAASGYTGPETVLEGRFGFLDAYCREGDPKYLTAGLREEWIVRRICIKRYPLHMAAHTPVQTLRELMAEHKFGGAEVDSIRVDGVHKLQSHHDIKEPSDITQGQYSVPFCLALALYRNPDDPTSVEESAVADPAIRAACRRVEFGILGDGQGSNKIIRLTVRLKDGRELVRDANTFKGMPSAPLTRDDLRYKFMLQTAALGEAGAAGLFERLVKLESQTKISLAP